MKGHQRLVGKRGRCIGIYQLQPPRVRFVLDVLSEVEAIHVLVDEPERMYFSRVHPHERYYVHTSLVKEVGYMNFMVKPLQGTVSDVLGTDT